MARTASPKSVRQCIERVTERSGPAEAASAQQCRIVRETFDRVGDKWSLLLIVMLATGTKRFTALKASIVGISQRMLTLTLRHLERDGLVTRTVFPEVPPRVEYALTPLGRSLIGPATALADWAVANDVALRAARARHESRRVGAAASPRKSASASS